MRIIYLDLDGVCTNFIESCIVANGFESEKEIQNWKDNYAGEFNASKVLNISNNKFWGRIEKCGEEFWSEMKPYPYFKELYRELSNLGKVYFLTSPSQDPLSLSGKLKWLQNQFNRGFKDYIITPNKELLANKNRFLIDDYPINLTRQEERGFFSLNSGIRRKLLKKK